MNTMSFLVLIIYIIFVTNTVAFPTKCPNTSADWCKTKEIAASCGVRINTLLFRYII